MTEEKKHSFVGLDGLRGIAALCVVFYHYAGHLSHHKNPWITNAFYAVDFFFILSGFVIAHAYESRLLNSNLGIRKFFIIRLIRLYPLYFLGVTLCLLEYFLYKRLHNHTGVHFPLSYLFSILFLPAPYAALNVCDIPINCRTVFPLNGPSWSLSLELWINLLFALNCKKLKNLYLIPVLFVSLAALTYGLWRYSGYNMGYEWPTYWGVGPEFLGLSF